MTSDERPVGQTKSQGWEIGVRRTLPLRPEKAWRMIMTELGLAWEETPDDPVYQKGTKIETGDKTRIEIVSYERGSLLRMRWQPPDWNFESTLQIRIKPAKTGTTVSIHHEWLQNGEQREAMRTHWTAVLDQMAESAGTA